MMRALAVVIVLAGAARADDVRFVPTARYESDFGATAGVTVSHSDIVELHADFGGRYRQAYAASVRSGRHVPIIAFALAAGYEQRPDEQFFGIGDAASSRMRFREDLARISATIDIPFSEELGDALKTRFTSSFQHRELLGETFGSMQFGGALVLDTRVLDARIDAGMSRDLASDEHSFSYYGGELRSRVDLSADAHVLGLRVLADTIETGTPRFVELPQLGGPDLLRGYPRGRFRDRALVLASIEYTWILDERFATYAFVDAGRVWPALSAVTLDDPRVGYGAGIHVHATRTYAARVQAAASRDGDVVLELVLAPAR